jgi:hypothetical protein
MGLLRRDLKSEMRIEDAVAQGLVSFEVFGRGEGVTTEVDLVVTKLTDQTLTLVVPRGTEFVPVEAG